MSETKKLEAMAMLLWRHLDEETDRLFTYLENPDTTTQLICDKMCHVGNIVELATQDSDILNYLNGTLEHSSISKEADSFIYYLPENISLVVTIIQRIENAVHYRYEIKNRKAVVMSFEKLVGKGASTDIIQAKG